MLAGNGTRNRSNLKADLLLLFVVAIWGSTFPIMKIILTGIDSFNFIALRFLLAFFMLAIIYRSEIQKINYPTLKRGALLGVFLSGGYIFQIVGLNYTTASRSGFITGLAVVLVPLLSIFILKEIPGLMNWVGVLLAIAGLYLLTGVSSAGVLPGDYLTLGAAFSFGMQIVLLSKYLKKDSPVVLTLIQLGVVAFGALLVSLLRGGFGPLNLPTVGVIVYTGIMATAFAYLVQGHAQQFTPPTHAALIFTMEPVFAALFSFLVLNELMGLSGIIGGIMIVLGMIAAELSDRRRSLSKGTE